MPSSQAKNRTYKSQLTNPPLLTKTRPRTVFRFVIANLAAAKPPIEFPMKKVGGSLSVVTMSSRKSAKAIALKVWVVARPFDSPCQGQSCGNCIKIVLVVQCCVQQDHRDALPLVLVNNLSQSSGNRWYFHDIQILLKRKRKRKCMAKRMEVSRDIYSIDGRQAREPHYT